MAVANGYGKVVTSGSVFMYDTGDTYNSYIGEPTTNIFKHYGTTGQGSAANNAVNFDVQGTTGFIRLGYGQTFGGYTIQPNDVVYRYDLGGYGCHYHGNDVSIPSGRSVTFTFDFYVSPGAASYPITNFLANIETGTGTGMSVGAPNNLTGVWQTISVTTGPSTSSGNIRMLLYPGACGGALAGDGYVLYKNPQVELLPHKTPFTQTSRSVTGSLLPLVSNSTLNLSNVSFDSSAQMTFDGTDDKFNTGIGNLGNNATYEAIIYCKGNVSTYNMFMGQLLPYIGVYNGNSIIYSDSINSTQRYPITSGGTISYNKYHHVICTREYDGSNTTMKIYIDNILQSQTNWSGAATYNNDTVNIGDGQSSTWYPFYGDIPIAKTYNRALTPSEVTQNYNKYKTRFNLS
jgi:hypothetical protein